MVWGPAAAEGQGQEEKVLEASVFVPALPKPFSFIPSGMAGLFTTSATKFHLLERGCRKVGS